MRRPAGYLGAAIFLLGGFAALAGSYAFTAGLEASNSVGFCISCHEMERTVYREYRKSIHFRNRTGVSAGCADCHVPKSFAPKLARKILAVKDVYHHLLGTIDTAEKFEERRAEMAQTVWAYMKASGSRECRSCHAFAAMNMSLQGRRPQEKHPQALEEGKTCIDCHKGVAHNLPRRDD